MERPTKEFATSGGNKIVHYTYLRGRDTNEIQSIFTRDAKVNMIGNEMKVEGFNPNSQQEATKKTLELLVVSVNGKTSTVVDDLLDLPDVEYQEIVSMLNEMTDKKKV